ncbi:Panacea domain-containing protein [Novosphingobium sp. M1R2S20]|uniref:Panacea domain-containing protein n=1 Tax=Novosphingobium rhizovicinum TaxID=3228928 RepID=A0ABV3RDH5_9SPHN
MNRAVAIANEFLAKAGSAGLTQMQLQKLVYFAHGWTLAITGEPLTAEEPQAWNYGPVYSDLYDHTKYFGSKSIDRLLTPDDDDAARFFLHQASGLPPYKATLTPTEKDIIDRVWKRYGGLTGSRLSALTHQTKTPWSRVFAGGSGKNRTIPNGMIKDHYTTIGNSVAGAA